MAVAQADYKLNFLTSSLCRRNLSRSSRHLLCSDFGTRLGVEL